MLVAQITDVHIGFDKGNPEEHNMVRLRAALDRLVNGANQPDLLILSGDLTEDGAPEDYARLEAHLELERQAVSDDNMQVRSTLLSDFHILLARIVGNDVLTDILEKLAGRSALITMLYQSTRDAACSSEEHRAFIAAARAGDTERAIELMEHHLLHVDQALAFEPKAGPRKDLLRELLS